LEIISGKIYCSMFPTNLRKQEGR